MGKVTLMEKKNKEYTQEEILEQKRRAKRVGQKRWQQRNKLKVRAAMFLQKVEDLRGRFLDQSHYQILNREVRDLLKLPYCWTPVDLARANASLTELERKYLGRTLEVPPKSVADATASVLEELEAAKLSRAEKVNVALEVLTNVGREFVLQAGEGITPGPDAALVLLTQDMQGTLPEWFAGSLAELLEKHLGRRDIRKFLRQLKKVIEKRDEAKYAEADKAARERASQDYEKEAFGDSDVGDILGAMGAVFDKKE